MIAYTLKEDLLLLDINSESGMDELLCHQRIVQYSLTLLWHLPDDPASDIEVQPSRSGEIILQAVVKFTKPISYEKWSIIFSTSFLSLKVN